MIGPCAYITGDTYPHKDYLKRSAAIWDPVRKMWWIGDKSYAEDIVKHLNSLLPSNDEETLDVNAKIIIGTATYKGKPYHLLVQGKSKTTSEPYHKLATKDGLMTFWAKTGEPITVEHRFVTPRSIADIQSCAKKSKRARSNPAVTTEWSATASQRGTILMLTRRVAKLTKLKSTSKSPKKFVVECNASARKTGLTSKEASDIIQMLLSEINDVD